MTPLVTEGRGRVRLVFFAVIVLVFAGLAVSDVVFAYSDVSHEYVMHKASQVMAGGANFVLYGPADTMIKAAVPVVAVCAVRTGADGRFTLALPAGPSRAIRLTYFPFSDSRGFVSSNTIVEDVHAPLTIRAAKRAIRDTGPSACSASGPTRTSTRRT